MLDNLIYDLIVGIILLLLAPWFGRYAKRVADRKPRTAKRKKRSSIRKQSIKKVAYSEIKSKYIRIKLPFYGVLLVTGYSFVRHGILCAETSIVVAISWYSYLWALFHIALIALYHEMTVKAKEPLIRLSVLREKHLVDDSGAYPLQEGSNNASQKPRKKR